MDKQKSIIKLSYLPETVTKPTHLELDNGQVQPRSTNGNRNEQTNAYKQTKKYL